MNPTGPLHAELAALTAQRDTDRKALREARSGLATRTGEQSALRSELVEAHANGDPKATNRVEAATIELDAVIAAEAIRAEGLALRANRSEHAHARYVSARLDGLLAEVVPEAKAARQALEDAHAAVLSASEQWQAVATYQQQDLIAIAGRSIELVVTSLPQTVTEVTNAAMRVEGKIPAPVVGNNTTGIYYEPGTIPPSATDDTWPAPGEARITAP